MKLQGNMSLPLEEMFSKKRHVFLRIAETTQKCKAEQLPKVSAIRSIAENLRCWIVLELLVAERSLNCFNQF